MAAVTSSSSSSSSHGAGDPSPSKRQKAVNAQGQVVVVARSPHNELPWFGQLPHVLFENILSFLWIPRASPHHLVEIANPNIARMTRFCKATRNWVQIRFEEIAEKHFAAKIPHSQFVHDLVHRGDLSRFQWTLSIQALRPAFWNLSFQEGRTLAYHILKKREEAVAREEAEIVRIDGADIILEEAPPVEAYDCMLICIQLELPALFSQLNRWGQTLAASATLAGQLPMIQRMARIATESGNILEQTNQRGQTCIHDACSSVSSSKFPASLESQLANPPLVRNSQDTTALSESREGIFKFVAEQLTLKHLCHQKDRFGWTPLHMAIRHDRVEYVWEQFEKDPDLHASLLTKDQYGQTFAHHAAIAGDGDCWLLKKFAEDPTLQGLLTHEDKHGQKIAHKAAIHGHLHILEWIASQASLKDQLDQPDNGDMTPWQLACLHGQMHLAGWFLERSPKPQSSAPSAATAPPAHQAQAATPAAFSANSSSGVATPPPAAASSSSSSSADSGSETSTRRLFEALSTPSSSSSAGAAPPRNGRVYPNSVPRLSLFHREPEPAFLSSKK